MTRANRHYHPGYVWHITHRCHKHEFLLKFAKDRRRWIHWLFEAKKRYWLCILNYVVTSNHIHLLVQDGGRGEIASSMQLIAGRTAQEFNQRIRAPRSVLGRPLPCDRSRYRRLSCPLSYLYRLEHGPSGCSGTPVRMGSWRL